MGERVVGGGMGGVEDASEGAPCPAVPKVMMDGLAWQHAMGRILL